MGDHHREQAEGDAEDLGEGVAEGEAGDDAGQGDRDHDQEGDRFPAEEVVPGDAQRGERSEHEAIGVATAPTLSELTKASLTSWLWIASPNHLVLRLSGGHFSVIPC